jgi:YidC/Oxa1 family membrane protein insertase
MSSEKRLVLTLVLTLGSVYGIRFAMEKAGWLPPEPEPAPAAAAKVDPVKGKAKLGPEIEAAKANAELPDKPFAPDLPAPQPSVAEPKPARPGELVLGSDQEEDPAGYHLRVVLDQKGAAVAEATSAKYEAELDPAAPRPRGRLPRLKLIGDVPKSNAPGSLSMTLASAARIAQNDAEDSPIRADQPEAWLDKTTWEVVRQKDDAPAVRTSVQPHPVTKVPTEVQELSFRTTSVIPPVTVTKVYRIWKGDDGFEVELRFASPTDAKFQYRLFGPHGIPIEGEWYTSTFRDVFFGQVKGSSTDIWTKSSYDVVKYDKDPSYRLTELPLKFAGVEDQYFATLIEPWPIPRSKEERWDQEAGPVVFQLDKEANQKSDVGVEIVSKPITVGPSLGEVVHTYRVFAGPKITSALLPYEAEELASYRKQYIPIPGATWLAKSVIAPLLDRIYALTQSVARTFGWKNGNYGIAIILLTMTVRLIMFPLGRKQAMMAKKMQDLQPVLAEVKEKFKDDKEALTRETMAVWKRHKVNPAAGCIPALIQMPIFVGLWQSLNNSVALRHSTFLYIRDLAAPDMLFRLPVTLPFGIGEYFNLLPFLVVSLMLVQTKLFAPPPTTPEAEMNQKMMKYMMIFMAFMFYKVPSGLGLYFITSSLWQIGERLLLPKIIAKAPEPLGDGGEKEKGRGPGGPAGGGPGPNGAGPGGNGNGVQGWLGKRLEKILEEASKDKTIRNDDRDRERDRDRDRDRPRPKPRPGKRR